MTRQHQQKLQDGRATARHTRRVFQAERVAAYQAWLHAGGIVADIPEIPTDADYKAARNLAAETARAVAA